MKRIATALVTGATSGIGAAVARALAADGMRVLLAGRQPRKLAAAAASYGRRRPGGTLCADLSSVEGVRELVTEVAVRARRLDLLVHCAGEYDWTRAGSANAADFARLFDINVRAPYLLTQALVPQLTRARGMVVFLNSSVTRNSGQGVALYKATQHAVQGFTDSLRQDLNLRGIRLVSLYPGRTATPRMRRIYAHEGRPYRPAKLLRPADIAELVVALTHLPPRMEITDLHLRSASAY